MMYEALTAGCRVGVIMIDRLKQDRITQSIDAIAQAGLITETTQLEVLALPNQFKEAHHVAKRILNSHNAP